MALREFSDPSGTRWQVWRVQPSGGLGALDPGALPDAGRSGAAERLSALSPTPGLESGWLCFESEREKRRLTPVPEGWDSCTEAELESYRLQALPVLARQVQPEPESPSPPVAG